MKKILILYPHFPPSNLAGVHRPRLFAQHLPEFGWEPILLTVHEDFYEEKLDLNLEKLLPPDLKIHKVKALPISKPRIIGDIGLRGFFQLFKKAKEIIKNERIDFLYIPIPSFYCALLGRWLHFSTGIKYGIDYIDPWVHHFPGSEKFLSRHWFSTKVSHLLEPIAVKHASLITGVAEAYYTKVLDRNPILKTQAVTGAMPYGGEKSDHKIAEDLNLTPYLFKTTDEKFRFVYAGAMLPKAFDIFELMCELIAANPEKFSDVEFHFIGTGKKADDNNAYGLKHIAEKHRIWKKVIFEYPARIPYLDVLTHLNVCDAVFILGSTEPHYTPSKTYQGVLSAKPIFAVLHDLSTAARVIIETGAGKVVRFSGEKGLDELRNNFVKEYLSFRDWSRHFDPLKVDTTLFEQYSARNVSGQLAQLLDQVFKKKIKIKN